MNLILDTDSYKTSHFLQYPPGTEHVTSYIEPRKVAKGFELTDGVVNFGLQMYLNKLKNNPVTMDHIREAEGIIVPHGLPFNRAGWELIVNKYGGFLPLTIESLPEGIVMPVGTCQVQVRNTDPELFWLTSYVETSLLRAIWYPSTVATLSREIKILIKSYMEKTCDNLEKLPFMLHDFGSRGVSSQESAGIGGLAHLVNFMGTDTLESLTYARDHYNCEDMPAFSVPAAEHSTITSWGEENEDQAFSNMVDKFANPGAIVSVVSDSYSIINACQHIWGETLRNKVKESGATIVVRPDSGDPATVVLSCLNILGDKFGHTLNTKGYKVLHPSIRVIQGDGINYYSIRDICDVITEAGWAMDNLVFGMGGALLQQVNRDTLSYAMKANSITINGKTRPVFKKPLTDTSKSSKMGRQMVVERNGRLITIPHDSAEDNMLSTTWSVVEGHKYHSSNLFSTVRSRAEVK